MAKVAVVTGSNKGIGYAIVRGLCKAFEGDVYLLSRDVGRGEEAVAKLQQEGLHPKFHQLDITDKQSIKTLAAFLKEKYGGLDILVNNAGIAYKEADQTPFAEQADVSINVNYFGLLNVCDALFPLLRAGARVVHLSSGTATIAFAGMTPEVRAGFYEPKSIDDLSSHLNHFVAAVKAGTHQAQGWPGSAYGTSKAGITALTPLQQQAFDADTSRPDIVVNAVCPGYVATDMTSRKGPRTPDKGAETPIYLALLPAKTNVSGQFLRDKKAIDWKVVLELKMADLL